MNVTVKNSRLIIEATNDLSYVLRQLPIEFNHRKSKLPAETRVSVSIKVDGIYDKKFDRKVDLTNTSQVAAELQRILKLSSKEMAITVARPLDHSFSVQVSIELEYPSLGDCTSDDIIATVQKRLKAVQKLGLNIREPELQD